MHRRPPGKLKGAAQALYTQAPSDAEIRASGWEPEDFAEDDFEVWPECWTAITLFQALGTQWRVGFSGATGLDYTAAYPLLDRFTETPDEWTELFSDLRVLESEALATMARNRPTT